MILAQSFVVWRICLTSLHAIAALSTILRLYHRVSTRRWWWDDTSVCLALIADCIYLASLWILPDLPHTQVAQTWALWFSSLPFMFLLGFTRVGLVLSLARIFPHRETKHRIIICMTIGIALAYSTLVILTSVYCGLPNAIVWSPMLGVATCKSLQWIALATMCAGVDIISDSFIVAIPLTTLALWNIRLPRNQRRLLLAGFSSGIWTTAISIAGAIVLLRYRTPLLGEIMPHLEAIVSLLSCNFLVVAAMIHRVLQQVDDLEDPSCDSNYMSTLQLSQNKIPRTGILPTGPFNPGPNEPPMVQPIGYLTASSVDSLPEESEHVHIYSWSRRITLTTST